MGARAGVNGRRSMVVDFSRTNPDGWDHDHTPDVPLAQTVVWETHVGDFSNDPAGGFPESHRGKYLAFTDDGTSLDGHPDFPTGIAYLKKLGITAVQLMPIYDFGSVDEETCDRYNWGTIRSITTCRKAHIPLIRSTGRCASAK